MENTNVNEIIAKVQSSSEFGGAMYTQEQVINILKMVQCTKPEQAGASLETLQKIEAHLESLEAKVCDLEVDVDSAEFEMNYNNCVELNSCDITGKEEIEKELDALKEFVGHLIQGYEMESEG